MAEEIDLEVDHFRNFKAALTLTLTLEHGDLGIAVHHSSTSTHIPTLKKIGRKKVWTDGRTDGRADGHFYRFYKDQQS